MIQTTSKQAYQVEAVPPARVKDPSSLDTPTGLSERLPALDVLRGFALLGILMLNILAFASPATIHHDVSLDATRVGAHQRLNLTILFIQWMFFEGKMRALFSVLFGAGSVLLLRRLEHRSGVGRAADIFHRRNMWLLAFGLIHGLLIWSGDVLVYYSSLALLVLYPLRNVNAKRLIYTGFAITLIGGSLGTGIVTGVWAALPAFKLQESASRAIAQHQPLTRAELQVAKDQLEKRRVEVEAMPKKIAEGRQSYLQSEPSNAAHEVESITGIFSSGLIFEVLGMLIAGMGLLKNGFLIGDLAVRTYLKIAAVGYGIGLPLVVWGLHHSLVRNFTDAEILVCMFLPYTIEQTACMMANASVLLLFVKWGRCMPVQRALAAVGRAAFSNYILTSLIGQLLFKWGPWKLYGALRYYQQMYVVAAIWTINVLLSLIWLHLFNLGPLEWAWRSLTYWKLQQSKLPAQVRPLAH